MKNLSRVIVGLFVIGWIGTVKADGGLEVIARMEGKTQQEIDSVFTMPTLRLQEKAMVSEDLETIYPGQFNLISDDGFKVVVFTIKDTAHGTIFYERNY